MAQHTHTEYSRHSDAVSMCGAYLRPASGNVSLTKRLQHRCKRAGPQSSPRNQQPRCGVAVARPEGVQVNRSTIASTQQWEELPQRNRHGDDCHACGLASCQLHAREICSKYPPSVLPVPPELAETFVAADGVKWAITKQTTALLPFAGGMYC